uniref:Uncharacterized protein n=1 Tax=Meloidogyne hapla TaxID=6305 RepID=A0A1I8AX51_MELHA
MNYSYENYSTLVIFLVLCTFSLYCKECWARINRTFIKITTKNNEIVEQQRIATSKLEINPEKLDLLLYNVAIFCLLKSKAHSLLSLPNVHYTERKLYEQCEDEGDYSFLGIKNIIKIFPKIAVTAAQLAKCIVPLIKEKENKRSTKEINIDNEVISTRTVSEKEERGLVRQFGSWLVHGLESIGFNEKAVTTKRKTNVERRRFEQTIRRIRKQKELLIVFGKNHYNPFSNTNENNNITTSQSLIINNIEKIRRVQRFLEKYEFCKKHLVRMGDANSRFIGDIISKHSPQSHNPVNSQSFQFLMDQSKLESLDIELQNLLSNYSFEALPILSPRLFSLFPNQKLNNDKININGFLSPTLLSFHEEGIFSLPTLFGYASSNERELLEFLDKFMELTGASKVLDKLIVEIETKANIIESEIYPALIRLELLEKRWKAIQNNLTSEQNKMFDLHGYALLDERQSMKLLNRRKINKWQILDEKWLEQDIHRMAEMESTRMKRNANSGNSSQEDKMDQINSLRPFTYTNVLRQDAVVAVNNVILSPKAFATTLLSPKFMLLNVLSPVAFIPSILSPKAMALTVLSPTAFTANILTPNTLWAEVLSPKFFHTNILSPRALASLILSPRTMLAEVLSPKFIEFRVLNPTTFYAGVLTPNFLLPRVLSPSNFAVTVLSPNILSPSILSKGNFTVQVLSPSIMSDDITIEQLFRGEWQKATN